MPVINRLQNIQRHWYYFFGLLLLVVGLAGSHWMINPYRLAVWVYSSDTGHIFIESRCEGQDAVALRHKQLVTAGYFEYRLPLPKCRLSSIGLTGNKVHDLHQEVSLATITYYGKDIQRLFGSARTLEGEGIFARDSRPKRLGAAVLSSPLSLSPQEIDTSVARFWWPRWLPLLLLPFAWWLSRKLTNQNSLDRESNAIGSPYSLLAVAVLSLITAMAVIARTDVSVHPDELSHVASAHYYFDHWLKPKIGALETLDTHMTNRFGVAYLTSTDPVYLFAGKFAVVTWPVFQNDVVALRMFNVALFGMLSFLLISGTNLRLALIPFFLTPQAWYAFSYFNGDALPLFLSTLAIVAFLRLTKSDPTSLGPVYAKHAAIAAIWAGCLAGLILLSKPNYWPVLGVIVLLLVAKAKCLKNLDFALLSLGWILSLFGVFFFLDNWSGVPAIIKLIPLSAGLILLLWFGGALFRNIIQKHWRDLQWFRLVAAVLLGLSAVVGIKMIDETLVNPPPFSAERAKALTTIIEHSAAAPFKPSSLQNQQTAKTYKLRDQGTGLIEMLSEENWFMWSFNSFLGVYGYMNIGPAKYFSYMLGCMFLIAALAILMMAGHSSEKNSGLQVQFSLLVGVITVIAASIGFSWIYDFEPQGRYLLAILPILGGGLVAAGPIVTKSQGLLIIILPAFLLAAMSFLLIGLQGIPKIPGLY